MTWYCRLPGAWNGDCCWWPFKADASAPAALVALLSGDNWGAAQLWGKKLIVFPMHSALLCDVNCVATIMGHSWAQVCFNSFVVPAAVEIRAFVNNGFQLDAASRFEL